MIYIKTNEKNKTSIVLNHLFQYGQKNTCIFRRSKNKDYITIQDTFPVTVKNKDGRVSYSRCCPSGSRSFLMDMNAPPTLL